MSVQEFILIVFGIAITIGMVIGFIDASIRGLK